MLHVALLCRRGFCNDMGQSRLFIIPTIQSAWLLFFCILLLRRQGFCVTTFNRIQHPRSLARMSDWQLQMAQTVMGEACAPERPGAPFQPLVCMQAAYNYGALSATQTIDDARREADLAEMRSMPAPVPRPSHAEVVSALASVGKFTPSNQFCSNIPH